jgi:hypothetical protein
VLLSLELLVVEANLVGRHDLSAELGNYLAINRYYTSKDKLIGLTA